MTAFDPIERQLSLARQGLTPPSELRGRVRARFGANEQLASAVAARAGGAVSPNRWHSLRASGNVGLSVGLALFGLGCVAGLLGSVFVAQPQSLRLESSIGAPHQVGEVTAPSAPAIPAWPPSEPEPAPPEPAAPPQARTFRAPQPAPRLRESEPSARGSRGRLARRPAQPATPSRDWRGELALLERAERAVRADNVALALALLGDFDVRFPNSLLVEERAAVETMAHCQADATDSAARTDRFLDVYPSSLYRARVEAVCQPGSPASAAQASDKKIEAGH
jgi:hypothetical protein